MDVKPIVYYLNANIDRNVDAKAMQLLMTLFFFLPFKNIDIISPTEIIKNSTINITPSVKILAILAALNSSIIDL